MRAPYVKTSERADPVSRQALLVERGVGTGQRFTDSFCPCSQAEATCVARLSQADAGISPVSGLDAPIDVVVDRAAGLLASPVVRLPVRERLAGAWPTSIRTGRPSWRTDGSGHDLLAKFLGQFSDLGFGVAAVAAEGLQEG